jgi:hypothetical protein
MAKRLAEYRSIGDPAVAASYRSSFKFYTQEKMLTAMLVYSAGFMFFVAVLMTKYHIEFILVCPLLMIYLGYYTHMTFCDESIVQTPELLFRNPTFAILTALLGALILGLAWVDIPQLDAWLGVSGQSW